jgi:hypothetical protein
VIAVACSPGAGQREAAPSVHVESRAGAAEAASTAPAPRAQPVEPSIAAFVPRPPVSAATFGRCFLKTPGVYGTCMNDDACIALGAHVSTPGPCGGGSDVSCCTEEPHLEVNPPPGWLHLPQAHVTSEMTAWALAIVGAPTTYPLGSTTTQRFGERQVMARVEWHPPSQTLASMHRGVSLYEPL